MGVSQILLIVIIIQTMFNIYLMLNILNINSKLRNGKAKMTRIDNNFGKVTQLMKWMMGKVNDDVE